MKHRTCKLEFHFPPAREPTHHLALAGIVEFDLEQLVPDFRSRNVGQSLVYHIVSGTYTQVLRSNPPTSCNKIEDRQTGVLPLERMFYHDTTELILRRKVLHLTIS